MSKYLFFCRLKSYGGILKKITLKANSFQGFDSVILLY